MTGLTDLADTVAVLREAGCVYAEQEAALLIAAAAEQSDDGAGASPLLHRLVARRAAGEPIELIVGWAQFCDRRIYVEAGVFIPRRRTEFLVRQAAQIVRPGHIVVDMCCGSGAVGAVLIAATTGVEIHAADFDPRATKCARRNLEPLGGQVHQGDLFEALPHSLRGRVDVIVANAPYVPAAEIALQPREARLHEPITALDGGADGAELHRRVASSAPSWLAVGGYLLIETGERQAAATAAAMHEAGLAASIEHDGALEVAVVVGMRS